MALLAHELWQVEGAEPALAGQARAFPAAEGLDAGPCAGRCAAGAIDVERAGLCPGEEEVDFGLVARIAACGEAIGDGIAVGDSRFKVVKDLNRQERQEQLVAVKRMVCRQAVDDGWLDIEAVIVDAAGEPVASRKDASVARRFGARLLEAAECCLVDDRANEDVAAARITYADRLRQRHQPVSEGVANAGMDIDSGACRTL